METTGYAITLNLWREKIAGSELPEPQRCARVFANYGESCSIATAGGLMRGELTGRMRYLSDDPAELPVAGDWVECDVVDENLAIIHRVLPRYSVLRRRAAGALEFQYIAANIDMACIIQSLQDDFNLNRLERYLVMVRDGGVEPVVLLSKADLVSEEESLAKAEEVRLRTGAEVYIFSAESGYGMESIERLLREGVTAAFVGSSGVGKTTLLNRLSGSSYRTAEVREGDGRGRHTTTTAILFPLEWGAILCDTPGMRELGHIGADEGLADVFDEIEELSGQCRFNDCTHTTEAGCALLQAVEEGRLDKGRYTNYLKLQRESAFHAMSVHEKRRRDKSFGKMVKQAMADTDEFKGRNRNN